MDEIIKEFLRQNPGSSSHRILRFYLQVSRQDKEKETKNHLFARLRKLKQSKVLINKGDRWFLMNGKRSEGADAQRTR
ncbi:hypothetical protein BSNK01_07820 [Bacillaceae bacterium]